MAIDWKSDEVRLRSAREYMLIAYALFGVYAWEFLITIYYDIRLLKGRAKRTWASLFYILSRYATLVALFVGLRITHAMTENVNCMGWNYALHAAAFSSVAFTSGLLYLRLCAVSGHSRPVIVGVGGAYLGYWAIVIYATYQSYAEYIPSLYICAATRLALHQSNTIYQFAFDVACLCLMLVYLMRMHRGGSLWTLLVQQGAVYFAAITVAYLIATVFIVLDLNDGVSQIPQVLARTFIHSSDHAIGFPVIMSIYSFLRRTTLLEPSNSRRHAAYDSCISNSDAIPSNSAAILPCPVVTHPFSALAPIHSSTPSIRSRSVSYPRFVSSFAFASLRPTTTSQPLPCIHFFNHARS